MAQDMVEYELECLRDRMQRLTALLQSADQSGVLQVDVAAVRACLAPTAEQEAGLQREMLEAVAHTVRQTITPPQRKFLLSLSEEDLDSDRWFEVWVSETRVSNTLTSKGVIILRGEPTHMEARLTPMGIEVVKLLRGGK